MDKALIQRLYVTESKSVSEIAKICRCSPSKVNYWIKLHGIRKRTVSEAIYKKRNPYGDPFSLSSLNTPELAFLKGLGLGLYWGEGTKSDKFSVRLGNTNARLIRKFIDFLVLIYGIQRKKLRFGLQLFNDSDPAKSLAYWINFLEVERNQFQKVIISKIRGSGTYKNKSDHGVLTVYFNNKKLRDIIGVEIEKL